MKSHVVEMSLVRNHLCDCYVIVFKYYESTKGVMSLYIYIRLWWLCCNIYIHNINVICINEVKKEAYIRQKRKKKKGR